MQKSSVGTKRYVTAKSEFQMMTTEHGFSLKYGFKENSVFTKHGFSLQSGFTEILPTPNIPLWHFNACTVLGSGHVRVCGVG